MPAPMRTAVPAPMRTAHASGREMTAALKVPTAEVPAVELPTAEVRRGEMTAALKVPTAEVPAVELPAAEVRRGEMTAALKVPAAEVRRGEMTAALKVPTAEVRCGKVPAPAKMTAATAEMGSGEMTSATTHGSVRRDRSGGHCQRRNGKDRTADRECTPPHASLRQCTVRAARAGGNAMQFSRDDSRHKLLPHGAASPHIRRPRHRGTCKLDHPDSVVFKYLTST